MSAPLPTRSIRLRPIALPVEHGGWSFLGAPILLGMWVAPSVAGIWLSLAALGAFLMRQPLKLALADRQRGRRYLRTVWAERFVALYGGGTLLAFGGAWWTADHPFWLPLILATPLAVLQLRYDVLKQSRAPIAEYSGAAAPGAVAAALALAGGWSPGPALLLWLLLVLQAIPAILYVTTRLRLARGMAAWRAPARIAHISALMVVGSLAWSGLAPWLTVVAFALLTIRAFVGLMPRRLATPTPLVGAQEVGFSLLTVASIALG